MATMKTLVTALLLMSGCATMTTGKRRWDGTDIGLETSFTIAAMLDAEQTAWNGKLGGPAMQCGESNPITGPCGDRVPPSVYLPAAVLLHGVAAHAIPHGRWRTMFQAVTLGFEAAVIYGNYALGYDTVF